jgi:hypothetical protein
MKHAYHVVVINPVSHACRPSRSSVPTATSALRPLKPESFHIGVAAGPTSSPPIRAATISARCRWAATPAPAPRPGRSTISKRCCWPRASLGVPMMIGSAGDTGTNSRVDMYRGDHPRDRRGPQAAPFKLGWFYSEVDKEMVRAKIRSGSPIRGPRRPRRPDRGRTRRHRPHRRDGGRAPLHQAARRGLRRHHRRPLLRQRRSSPPPALHKGYPEAQSYYLGKVLECASFCAEPYGAKETVMGEITPISSRSPP